MPRVVVAHQQMLEVAILALIATHPYPKAWLEVFDKLIRDLAGDNKDDESFLGLVERAAARFEGMVRRSMPAAEQPDGRRNTLDES